jgi:hypothetical protein
MYRNGAFDNAIDRDNPSEYNLLCGYTSSVPIYGADSDLRII